MLDERPIKMFKKNKKSHECSFNVTGRMFTHNLLPERPENVSCFLGHV